MAYVLLWFPEPTQTFILDEVNTLAHLGLEVRVYTLYGPRPQQRIAGMAPVSVPSMSLGLPAIGSLARELAGLRRHWGPQAKRFLAKVIFRRWRSLETAGEAFWAALAGVHLARQFLAAGIEHIHAPWADGPATAAWVAAHLSGISFSFGAHAHDIYPPDGALREKMAAAHFVRTISDANRRYLAALVPESADKIIKIPIGVPFPRARRTARAGQPPYRLLAIGRLVPKKGFPILITACHHLAKGGVNFHLILAGAGAQRRHLLGLIGRYGLSGRVTLAGFVSHPEIAELLSQADLLIVPSRVDPSGDRDGIPTVILEALLHEVPVVATDVSGIPEVIRPGETGWLTPPGDPEALARDILAALADPTEAGRRAQRGRQLVQQQFDSQKNYARLKTWLEKAIFQTAKSHLDPLGKQA